jgi:hypothetical protein
MPRSIRGLSLHAARKIAPTGRSSGRRRKDAQMDQVKPQVDPWHPTTRTLDLSSQTPSGGGQRADPGQKHGPRQTDVSRVKRVDKPLSVTEAQLHSLGQIPPDLRLAVAVNSFIMVSDPVGGWVQCRLLTRELTAMPVAYELWLVLLSSSDAVRASATPFPSVRPLDHWCNQPRCHVAQAAIFGLAKLPTGIGRKSGGAR